MERKAEPMTPEAQRRAFEDSAREFGCGQSEERFDEALRVIVEQTSKLRQGLLRDKQGYLSTVRSLELHDDGVAAVDRLETCERAHGQHDGSHSL